MTNNEPIHIRTKGVKKAANAFMQTLFSLEDVDNRAMADGLVTVLYSVLSISFKGDTKAYNEAINHIAKTMKSKYREANKKENPSVPNS